MKKLAILVSSLAIFLGGALLMSGCEQNNSNDDGKNVVIWDPSVTPPKNGPQFYEGFRKTLSLGESIILEEYIIYPNEANYSIILSEKDGDFEIDMTNQPVYTPLTPGKYILTYSISSGEYKGSNSIEIEVLYPKMDIEYTRNNDLIYSHGATITKEEFLNLLDIEVSYAYGYEINWVRVNYAQADGTTKSVDLSDLDSYTIEATTTHNFFFAVTSNDGQKYEYNQLINVKYTNPETLEWLESRNISVEGYIALNDNKSIVLGAGTAMENVFTWDYVPYLAYEGD